MKKVHKSVLLSEIIKFLNPKRNENFVDATGGEGGHSLAILKKNLPEGKILIIERDRILYKKLEKIVDKRSDRAIIVNDNFKNLKKIIKKNDFKNISGILFDLGMCSWHLSESKRGFSFKKNETLDMRFDKRQKIRAVDIINKWPEKEIEHILKEYGEERNSKKITKNIIKERKKKLIITSDELAKIIEKASFKRGKIHPATRTFQALRIEVNDELENIKSVLPQAANALKKGGKLAVISFHSLEDRIVKIFFREEKNKKNIKILTKKPIMASKKEIFDNPKSRSAKLRVAEKI